MNPGVGWFMAVIPTHSHEQFGRFSERVGVLLWMVPSLKLIFKRCQLHANQFGGSDI